MPTEKQEDLDRDDDEMSDQDLDDEMDSEEEADDRVGMGSPMGEALDAEDAKKGDVQMDESGSESDDDHIGDDATD